MIIDDAGSSSGNKAPLVVEAPSVSYYSGDGSQPLVFELTAAPNFAIGSGGVQHVVAFDAPMTGSGYSFGSTQTLIGGGAGNGGAAGDGQILAAKS